MLNVGVIGLGVGERHIYGFNNSPDARTVRICDMNIEKLADVSKRSGVTDTTTDPTQILLDPNIHIVSIASFDECHAEQVIMALEAGKHIFVEKPICLTEEELDAICAAYARAKGRGQDLKVSSNFILRREARFLALKQCIDAGDLGDIYAVEGCYDYGRVNKLVSGWRAQTPGYSVMHGGGIHILDLCQWLTGQAFVPQFALAHKAVTCDTNFQPPDVIFSLGHFGNGIIGKICANFGAQTAHFHQIKVYGTKGTFVHDCAKTTYFFGSEPWVTRREDTTPFPSSKKGDLLPEFVAAIVHGTPLEIDFDHVQGIMRTSLAVDKLAMSR